MHQHLGVIVCMALGACMTCCTRLMCDIKCRAYQQTQPDVTSHLTKMDYARTLIVLNRINYLAVVH